MNRFKRVRYSKILLGCLAGSYLQMFGALAPVFAGEPLLEQNLSVIISEEEGVLSYVMKFSDDLDISEGGYEIEQFWTNSECAFDGEGALIEESCEGLSSLETFTPLESSEYYVYVSVIGAVEMGIEPELYQSFNSYSFELPVVEVFLDPIVEVFVSDDGKGSLSYTVNVENYKEEFVLSQTWYEGAEIVGSLETFTPEHDGFYTVEVEVLSALESVTSNEQEIICSNISEAYSVVFPVIDDSQFLKLEYSAGERFVFNYTSGDEVVALTASLDGEDLNITKTGNSWTLSGDELLYTKELSFEFIAYTRGGFSSSYTKQFRVLPGIVDLANSKLDVTLNGVPVNYVEVAGGELDVVFEASDSYGNKINVEKLDRVDVWLNGTLLEGVDFLGSDFYKVERTAKVPSVEILESQITVDVFSLECEGNLGLRQNYCFSKIHNFVVYDTGVDIVENLVYTKRTKESVVRVSGTKTSGYGIKLNSTKSDFVVEPNDSTVFSFEIPLAEGVNEALVYSVKEISTDLVFYSNPVRLTIEKDTAVSSIQWNNPSITLDGENEATLHWTDPIYFSNSDSDFSHVNIYRSTFPNFVPSEQNLIVKTHNPSWTDTDLDSGANYYYAIEAVDDLGNNSLISQVISTGQILGESATSATTIEDVYGTDYVGKGYGDDLEEGDTGVSAEEDIDQDSSKEDGDSEDQEDSSEGFSARLEQFFEDAKDSVSTFFDKVTENIFVQICVGGISIFIGLMLLISLLVWLKEKIIDTRLVSLEDDEDASDA